MANTQELREQRAQIWEQMQEVVNRAEREGRPVGDRKVLGRRQSVTDLSMLEAVALAAHGASANDSLKGVGIW